MLDALIPLVAARLLAITTATLPGGWTADRTTTVAADGVVSARVCCTGWLKAQRVVMLPRGGTIRVDATAPCGRTLMAWLDGPGAPSTSASTELAPFAGTLTLTVPPGPPRTLTVYAEGGMQCCGAVEVRGVVATAAPPT